MIKGVQSVYLMPKTSEQSCSEQMYQLWFASLSLGSKSCKSKGQILPATIGILWYRHHREGGCTLSGWLNQSIIACPDTGNEFFNLLCPHSLKKIYVSQYFFCYYVSIFRISSKCLRSPSVYFKDLCAFQNSILKKNITTIFEENLVWFKIFSLLGTPK